MVDTIMNLNDERINPEHEKSEIRDGEVRIRLDAESKISGVI